MIVENCEAIFTSEKGELFHLRGIGNNAKHGIHRFLICRCKWKKKSLQYSIYVNVGGNHSLIWHPINFSRPLQIMTLSHPQYV